MSDTRVYGSKYRDETESLRSLAEELRDNLELEDFVDKVVDSLRKTKRLNGCEKIQCENAVDALKTGNFESLGKLGYKKTVNRFLHALWYLVTATKWTYKGMKGDVFDPLLKLIEKGINKTDPKLNVIEPEDEYEVLDVNDRSDDYEQLVVVDRDGDMVSRKTPILGLKIMIENMENPPPNSKQVIAALEKLIDLDSYGEFGTAQAALVKATELQDRNALAALELIGNYLPGLLEPIDSDLEASSLGEEACENLEEDQRVEASVNSWGYNCWGPGARAETRKFSSEQVKAGLEPEDLLSAEPSDTRADPWALADEKVGFVEEVPEPKRRRSSRSIRHSPTGRARSRSRRPGTTRNNSGVVRP